MRTLETLAILLVGLAIVFWAPTAKADCPHGGTKFDHPHCGGGGPGGATLGDLACSTDEIAKYDGTNWVCDDFFVSRIVFVSSDDTLTGNLGGEAGADATCNTLATNAGLTGNFKAWLGIKNLVPQQEPLGSYPLRNFTHATGPYILTDGTQVARDFSHLITGLLDSHIDLDENGDPASNSRVWTGVIVDGTTTQGGNCLNWTTASGAELGQVGFTGSVSFPFADSVWTQASGDFCDELNRIYCFEQ